jgi:rhodanese-related sulfurtransferase
MMNNNSNSTPCPHYFVENESSVALKNLKETTYMADASIIKSLKNPIIIIDVRSIKEIEACKGGVPIEGSFHVPINVDGQPQSIHVTTTDEFYNKLQTAGVVLDLSNNNNNNNNNNNKNNSYITHCTAGNTKYIGRCARAAAILRNLGLNNTYNGGSADEIRAALR